MAYMRVTSIPFDFMTRDQYRTNVAMKQLIRMRFPRPVADSRQVPALREIRVSREHDDEWM